MQFQVFVVVKSIYTIEGLLFCPRFLPALARQALDKALRDSGIEALPAADNVDIERALSCKNHHLPHYSLLSKCSQNTSLRYEYV